MDNFGGGERLIKILLKKKFSKLFIGYENNILKRFFLKRTFKATTLLNNSFPKIIKKLFLIKAFENLKISCDNCICSGNYSLLANINAKNKILYVHSMPKIFFRYKYFYPKYSLKVLMANIFFFSFKRKYIKALNSFDHIIANSKFTKKQIKKFTKKKVLVVYPPIEKFKFIKDKKLKDYFIFNNRHEKEKNLDKVLDAFSKLKCEKLFVLSTGSMTQRLKKKYKKNKNIFFKGLVNNKKYIKYISNCKAVINVSNDEDFGMGALEAMQFGKITICLKEGGYIETTTNGYNAIHINKNNISFDLVKKIKLLKKNDLKKMKRNCIETSKKYNEDKFNKLIHSVLIN